MYRTWIMVVLVSIAGLAYAWERSGPEIETRGEILAVSVEDHTVTLEEAPDRAADLSPGAMQSGVVREFLVSDATKLTENDEPIELGDVDVGAKVFVRYVMNDGINVALEIEVQSPATE